MATPTRKKPAPKRKKPAPSASVAQKQPDFEHRPVDHAGTTTPAGKSPTHSDKQRPRRAEGGWGDGGGRVPLLVRAPRRPAAALGRGLHHASGGRGEDLRRHAPRH